MRQWTMGNERMGQWGRGAIDNWTMDVGTERHGRWDRATMRMEQWGAGESHTGRWDNVPVGQWGESAMDEGTMHNRTMPWIICPRRMNARASVA